MPRAKKRTPPPRMHFRVDTDLKSMVQAYAEKHSVSVSEACRLILRITLGQDADLAAVTEAIYTFHAIRKRVINRMAADMQEQIPILLEEELQTISDA